MIALEHPPLVSEQEARAEAQSIPGKDAAGGSTSARHRQRTRPIASLCYSPPIPVLRATVRPLVTRTLLPVQAPLLDRPANVPYCEVPLLLPGLTPKESNMGQRMATWPTYDNSIQGEDREHTTEALHNGIELASNGSVE